MWYIQWHRSNGSRWFDHHTIGYAEYKFANGHMELLEDVYPDLFFRVIQRG